MSVVESCQEALGTWMGTNRLRLKPDDPYRDSESTATVALAARRIVTVAYTWVEEGEPQDGLVAVGDGGAANEAVGIWIDSWHQKPRWMELEGTVEDGVIRLLGDYAEGQAGWRITLDPSGESLRMTMDNILPESMVGIEGEGTIDYQAVEATYARR